MTSSPRCETVRCSPWGSPALLIGSLTSAVVLDFVGKLASVALH